MFISNLWLVDQVISSSAARAVDWIAARGLKTAHAVSIGHSDVGLKGERGGEMTELRGRGERRRGEEDGGRGTMSAVDLYRFKLISCIKISS